MIMNIFIVLGIFDENKSLLDLDHFKISRTFNILKVFQSLQIWKPLKISQILRIFAIFKNLTISRIITISKSLKILKLAQIVRIFRISCRSSSQAVASQPRQPKRSRAGLGPSLQSEAEPCGVRQWIHHRRRSSDDPAAGLRKP